MKTKKTRRKPSNQVKRFNPATPRLRENRAAAVEQEADARYQYHRLRNRYISDYHNRNKEVS